MKRKILSGLIFGIFFIFLSNNCMHRKMDKMRFDLVGKIGGQKNFKREQKLQNFLQDKTKKQNFVPKFGNKFFKRQEKAVLKNLQSGRKDAEISAIRRAKQEEFLISGPKDKSMVCIPSPFTFVMFALVTWINVISKNTVFAKDSCTVVKGNDNLVLLSGSNKYIEDLRENYQDFRLLESLLKNRDYDGQILCFSKDGNEFCSGKMDENRCIGDYETVNDIVDKIGIEEEKKVIRTHTKAWHGKDWSGLEKFTNIYAKLADGYTPTAEEEKDFEEIFSNDFVRLKDKNPSFADEKIKKLVLDEVTIETHSLKHWLSRTRLCLKGLFDRLVLRENDIDEQKTQVVLSHK